MAEDLRPAPSSGGGRQIIILATVIMVVIFAIFLVGLRSCSSSKSNTADKSGSQIQSIIGEKPAAANSVIYSNLDLKDAASVVVRLKDLKIPYQLLDGGKSIAVAKGRADEARLGLAEKNLPTGGTIGWEIFDQSKLGATDFDRRIQFIRAVSGELSRTINRISSVQDARVQIVIPETKMFETTTSPVTAAVLIKMNPGMNLSQEQVNAIVYLVAGSVENLKPANITIIDTDGNILTGGGVPLPTPKVRANIPQVQQTPITQSQENNELIVEKAQEKEALEVQAKMDLEDRLTSKVQSILSRIFPQNTVMVKVNVDSLKDRRTNVVILVDRRYKLTNEIKSMTTDTVSAVIGYDKSRGDRIVIKSTTFGSLPKTLSRSSSSGISAGLISFLSSPDMASVKNIAKKIYKKYGRLGASAVIVIPVIIFLILFRMIFLPHKTPAQKISANEEANIPEPVEAAAPEESVSEEIPIVDQMRDLAIQRPEQAAELIKQWIAEENS